MIGQWLPLYQPSHNNNYSLITQTIQKITAPKGCSYSSKSSGVGSCTPEISRRGIPLDVKRFLWNGVWTCGGINFPRDKPIENVKEVHQGFDNRFINTYLIFVASTKRGESGGGGGGEKRIPPSLFLFLFPSPSSPLLLPLPFWRLPRSPIHTMSENMGARMDPWSYRATLDNSDSNTLLSWKTT